MRLYGTLKCGCDAEATRIGLNGRPHRIWLGFVANQTERFTDKPIWEGEERKKERKRDAGDEFTRTLIATSSVVSSCMSEHP